jgi:glycosyltransferase involved in cell wall biosynthesis
MFCGRIQQVKMPMFFASVCSRIRMRRGRCRALVVGDGVLRDEMLGRLQSDGVDATYSGFLPPAQLPRYYESSRLLLFPTSYDPWGLVANEALACGTPVFTTSVAGCAGDLVLDGVNGRVLAPEADGWAAAACELLESEASWAAMSANACGSVADFNVEAAAAGIHDACERAH